MAASATTASTQQPNREQPFLPSGWGADLALARVRGGAAAGAVRDRLARVAVGAGGLAGRAAPQAAHTAASSGTGWRQ
jgi:hypothetical protein